VQQLVVIEQACGLTAGGGGGPSAVIYAVFERVGLQQAHAVQLIHLNQTITMKQIPRQILKL
jgi:hypothetical protein